MSLGTDKYVMENIEAHAAAKVPEEMIRAAEIGASEEIARHEWIVEADAGRSDSCLQLGRCLFSQPWRPHSVKVIEDRTKRLKTPVNVLLRSPVDLCSHAEVVSEEKISVEPRKCAAAD